MRQAPLYCFGVMKNLINEEILRQVEDYISKYFLDVEALRKRGVKLSYSNEYEDDIRTSEKIIRKLKDIIGMTGNFFSDYLWKLIDEKNMTDVEVYKKAHLDRRIFSKIRNEKNYMPSKRTILVIAIALELDYKETTSLLHRAGYHLGIDKKDDVIIGFFIKNKIYDLFLINEVLDHFGFKTLGD